MPGPPKPTNIHVDSQPLISIDGHHVPCNGIFTYYMKGWNLWAVKEMLGGWSINPLGHPKKLGFACSMLGKKLTYSPKWWFDGDLPRGTRKTKNHRKKYRRHTENHREPNRITVGPESRTKRVSSWFFATKSGQSCKSFPNAKPRSCCVAPKKINHDGSTGQRYIFPYMNGLFFMVS